MLLAHSTWQEVAGALARSNGIFVPTGSTEQHGPIGLIGTDAICAESIAAAAGAHADALVGPTLAIGVAQFNLAFPGTVSLRAATFMALVEDYVRSLARQGFRSFYFLNGHGGNLAPLRAAIHDLHFATSMGDGLDRLRFRVRSWWEYAEVDRLRREWYGEAEGMHATPSEIAITQHVIAASARSTALPAPARLTPAFLREHAGDNHDDAATHRARFPDGRVGSDSSLADPEQGRRLFEAAAAAASADYLQFLEEAA